MNWISWGDVEEDLLREKLHQLKRLQEIKTKDLVMNYLIHFILLVKKIIAKSEEEKRGAELNEEKKKKKIIQENIHKIKQKLTESKHGANFKREEILYEPDGWSTLDGGDDLRERLPDKLSAEEEKDTGQVDKGCNIAQICKNLTEGFHMCISLLLKGMKECRGKPIPEEGDGGGSDGKVDKTEQSGVKSSDSLINSGLPSSRREQWGFHLSLLYLALCFYHMHLISDKREKYHLHVSLFLLLLSFPLFKDKEIEHYVCLEGNVYLRFDVSVPTLLSHVCKIVGLNCKQEGDTLSCLFFLTHSFLFLQCAHKGGSAPEGKGAKTGTDHREGEKKKYNSFQDMINIIQAINQVLIEFNFFTESTFLVMGSIDLHSFLLRNEIEKVRKQWKSMPPIKREEPVTGTPKDNPPNGELVYLNEELTQDDCHFYMIPSYVDTKEEGEKRVDAQIEKKMDKIMETTTSLFDSINECMYLFIDLHFLSIYEHLVLFSLYMAKDVSKLFHQFKGEKKKKKLSQRYKYMAYRNLLEIYIIYLKHNYLRYSNRGGGDDDTYVRACQVYRRLDEARRTIRSLLQGYDGRSNTHMDNNPIGRKKGNVGKKENTTTSCTQERGFLTREYFHRKKICIRARVIDQGEDDIEANSYLESIIRVSTPDVKTMSNEEPTHYSRRKEIPSKLFGDIFSLVEDSNIVYQFICEQIANSNTFNFDVDEEVEGKLKQNDYVFPRSNEQMTFSTFLRGNIKKMDGLVGEIFSYVWHEATRMGAFPCTVASEPTTATTTRAVKGDAFPWVKIHLDEEHAEDFLQIFHFKKINLPHMQFDVCNFSHTEYAKLATDKMKKIYRNFSKGRAEEQSEKWHLPSVGITHGGKQSTCIGYCEHAHYLCHNFDEVQFLFKKVKKYKKKTLAYFSLDNETTLHLDILLNSSESYFYFNFFTKSYEEYMYNCRQMLNCISAPLPQITNQQYLSFRREMALKSALILKDIFICSKYNTFIDNMYVNDHNKNKNLHFDDHIQGPLTGQEKGLILQIVKYYLLFLSTYQIGTGEEFTNPASFQTEEEKKSYFDIYFYVCKTLSTVDDKNFIVQAIQHYQRLLNYAAKNKMYADDGYNEYMRDVCRKSICVLRGKMLDLA
ncbi:conserved Plasmodium protein, unknown function [Plasmodium knowlesi strain H]|uniref:KIF-binding protein n=3 Tax=Plasmodium knowlesi TaxID=5850 RepID=A0A5K1UMS0_PLAKH|nr:conserved Plasmodium protein, unknown function [Plasmodium knowlesi strain H]OTN65576.1 Uncharacterized protein PKNOH_S110072200 [Plasmodium knowlesi]CAA9989343.1 conserved Plasmodium protein, unknown function [Plasmodium knowlesi strain H]SBO24910.1 conserved Plasmodium protein, unknown function [Plasmodium knowlesi strain H]SBO27929.1 conserved Plasmodium protein, unknown function [Plasmodium knowlesi strain H]VVS78817.1 conserved Plasmodium protein, unknown function [Plasmodium knowlesi |eukprot:XP_002260070.1 hypothetical protein, conserved in Plasmodium species [Plasmodium knowlesi strain H]